MKCPLVFTNGCFDVLHRGHVELLQQAALNGRLIIAVDSDENVRALKGPTRPVNKFEDRVAVLQALQPDALILRFDCEDQLRALLHAVRPRFYVKGADWEGRVTNPYGEMIFVPHRYPLSTTKTLDALGPLVP